MTKHAVEAEGVPLLSTSPSSDQLKSKHHDFATASFIMRGICKNGDQKKCTNCLELRDYETFIIFDCGIRGDSHKLCTMCFGTFLSKCTYGRNERSNLVCPIPGCARAITRDHVVGVFLEELLNTSCQPTSISLFAVLIDLCRRDANCWEFFVHYCRVDPKTNGQKFLLVLQQVLMQKVDKEGCKKEQRLAQAFTANSAIYILTGVVSHCGGYGVFSTVQISNLIDLIADATTNQDRLISCASLLGKLDGICNLAKYDEYRMTIWSSLLVRRHLIFNFGNATVQASVAYRIIFILWLLTFNDAVQQDLGENCQAAYYDIIGACLVPCLTSQKAEKVIRIAILLVKNLVEDSKSHKHNRVISNRVVEAGTLKHLHALEYEKWKDQELYADIRNVCNLVGMEQTALSTFERYQLELKDGSLKWSYLHTAKFWEENYQKFSNNNFAPLKELMLLLRAKSSDNVTQAVACHDLGEFARLFPSGKQVLSRLNAKGAVMELMSHDDRDVAREALHCVQKIMLNRWRELNNE